MKKRELITGTIGIILIIIGLIILVVVPEAKIKFFVGFLITWLGAIIMGFTLRYEYFNY